MARFEQFIDPERVEVGEKAFYLSKLPATEGRELVMQYPTSAVPKLGDYATNEAMMFKLLARVAVEIPGGTPLALETRGLIDNHVADWEMLVKLEGLMIAKNCSFFANGGASSFFEAIVRKLQASGIQMLTQSLGQLLAKSSPPGTN